MRKQLVIRGGEVVPDLNRVAGVVCYIRLALVFVLTFIIPLYPSIEDDVFLKRPFTVKDSIETSYIVDPARFTGRGLRGQQPLGFPIYSPDDKAFLLVTQRGLLSDNALEGTIWLFDRETVRDYVLGKSRSVPVPRKLASVMATSNTPVIDDVRWIDGSKRIAFLGKDRSPYQQLFLADVDTGQLMVLTKGNSYVTAYDIRGDAIAYTALTQQRRPARFDRDFIEVNNMSIYQLLYRNPVASADLEEGTVQQLENSLHIVRGGKEIPMEFKMEGSPLRLFVPTLSLSPDAKSLITVAPIQEIPKGWDQYVPRLEMLRVKPGPYKNEYGIEGDQIPARYAIVNLETGSASSLVDAPAGRDLGYISVPTGAFWLEDNRHVVLTNTYRPFSASTDATPSLHRTEGPAVTVVDVPTREIGPDIELRPLEPPLFSSGPQKRITGIIWSETTHEVTIQYSGPDPGDDWVSAADTYALRSGKWLKTEEGGAHRSAKAEGPIVLTVRQDLNHPPMLWGRAHGKSSDSVIWDPNPQLPVIKMGKTALYSWKDENGKNWAGVLALPPDYDTKRRYPLVIQTHGFDASKFFSDGEYTTGSGGLALVAKNIIILQMEESVPHFSSSQIGSPEEAPENLAGFESAVNNLADSGLVDRTRVGVIGFSRTCFHVLYALARRPNLFAAASVTDGVNFSYVEYLLAHGMDEYLNESEIINGGPPFGNNLTKWTRNAPNFGLDKIKTPLLISALHQGNLLSQWETYSGLRRLSKPVEMLFWWKENTPHILVQPAQRYASQQSAVDWFDFWLNGREDTDPTKAEQYARWRELRKLQEQNAQHPQQANPPSVH